LEDGEEEVEQRRPMWRPWMRPEKQGCGCSTPCTSTTAHSGHAASPHPHRTWICIAARASVFSMDWIGDVTVRWVSRCWRQRRGAKLPLSRQFFSPVPGSVRAKPAQNLVCSLYFHPNCLSA
jgi:hypothetical protein